MHENKLAGETHCHKNGFAQKFVLTLRQREVGNGLFCQETGKNELLCLKNFVAPSCDYAVAMATLKVVDTQLNIRISARDEWTFPESFNIIEEITFSKLLPPSPTPPFEGKSNFLVLLVGDKFTNWQFRVKTMQAEYGLPLINNLP